VYTLGTFADRDDLQQSWTLWREVANHRAPSRALRDAMLRRQQEWTDAIRAYIVEGQGDGSVAPGADPDAAAQLLSVLVDGLHPSLRMGAMDRAEVEAVLRQAVADRLD
jgi:hypothetical protein